MNQTDTQAEIPKEQASTCGPGCCCGAMTSGKTRWLACAIIIAAAGILVARAVIKKSGSQTPTAETNFALPSPPHAVAEPAPRAPSEKPQAVEVAMPSVVAANTPEDQAAVCGELLDSLGDLNSKARDKDGVFVFLAGQDIAKNREIAAVIEKGAATLRGRNISIGVFTLKDGSAEYTSITRQVPPPGVIAMVKGRGATAVNEDVTEPKLIQAFVAAASAGGCGPSGCGPSGCR